MKLHEVRVHPSKAALPREEQLAWKIAAVAADRVAVERDVTAMIVNRMIDNAAVAIAAVNRSAPISARGAALGHARRTAPPCSARLRGCGSARNGRRGRMVPRCASWICTTPSSPPIIRTRATTSRRCWRSRRRRAARGATCIRGIATGYEIQIDLVRAICLHEAQDRPHRPSLCRPGGRDRHAAAAADRDDLSGGAAGGACERHDAPIAQGRDQLLEGLRARPRRQAGDRGGRSLHARRRRAEPDLRRRGQRDRLDAGRAGCRLPGAAAGIGRGQARHPDSYTKEHSAEYQAQALIDLAFRVARAHRRPRAGARRSSSTRAITPIT